MPNQNSSTEEKKKQMDKAYETFQKKMSIIEKIMEKLKKNKKDS